MVRAFERKALKVGKGGTKGPGKDHGKKPPQETWRVLGLITERAEAMPISMQAMPDGSRIVDVILEAVVEQDEAMPISVRYSGGIV